MNSHKEHQNPSPESNHNETKRQKEEFFRYIDWKPGMEVKDKQEITRIIETASSNTRYYERQGEIRDRRRKQIEEMMRKIEKTKTDKQEFLGIQYTIETKRKELEKQRNLTRTWAHFDLDMFYVACEIRDRPELADKPVAVGMNLYINTANYIARKFGIYSAMPGFIAQKLCPELIVLPPSLPKYQETSNTFKKILSEYDPKLESRGMDEATLDMTDYLERYGITEEKDIEKLLTDIKASINEATGITCTCGIAPNKMLAKIACDTHKPNGIFYVKNTREDVLNFMMPLSVRKVPGIGIYLQEICFELNIETVKDILDHLEELYISLPENTFMFFLKSALGIGRYLHDNSNERKSVSATNTIEETMDREVLENVVKQTSAKVADNLKKAGKKARRISIMVKSWHFRMTNKSTFLARYSDEASDIEKAALRMFREVDPQEPTRCIALKAEDLKSESELRTLDNYFTKKASSKKEGPQETTFFESSQSDIYYDLECLYQDENSRNLGPIQIQMQTPTQPTQVGETLKNAKPEPEVETPKSRKEKIITSKKKASSIKCPVCNQEFESSINSTRINNHIDKCLMQAEHQNQDLDNESSNSTTVSENTKEIRIEIPHSIPVKELFNREKSPSSEKKKNSNRRKQSDNQKTIENKLKKMKKTQNSSSETKKTLDFFLKKK